MIAAPTGFIPQALAAGTAALAGIDPRPDGLFPLTIARVRAERGLPDERPAILAAWAERGTSVVGRTRYPWTISPRFDGGGAAFVGAPSTWRAWRPRDAEALREGENRATFESRLLEPLVLASTVDELVALSRAGGPPGDLARGYLAEHRSKLRRDVSRYLGEQHAWGDTWALWCLAAHPRALGLLQPFALAIASGHAEQARLDGGVVLGSRYPFHGEPLASASAQLARGLVALGVDLDLAGAIVDRLRTEQRPDGGWGDADGPSDVLTTYVVADLLAGVDPTFDPAAAAGFLVACQRRSGLWRAYGPETAWLTVAVTRLLEAATTPFAARFRAPAAGSAVVDRRTGLPRYEHYRAVADLAAAVPGLAAARFEVAFLDLIGFRAFNNTMGMAEGDAALAFFARCLGAFLPGTIAIRDGGDEFLVIATPAGEGSGPLAARMRAFLEAWRPAFGERFPGAPPVAPRILVGCGAGRDLVPLRDELGRAVGRLKHERDQPITGFVIDVTADT
jgi:GGDEF domain-containing protein